MPDFLRRRKSRYDRHLDPYDSDSDISYHRHRSRSSSYDSFDRGTSRDHHSRRAYHHERRSHSVDRHKPSHQDHGRRNRRDSPYPVVDEKVKRKDHEFWSDKKLEHATIAALDAAAVEAFRLRHEPGKWAGRKGARVATAALGAAAVDMAIDKDPGKHTKRTLIEAAIGGLVANRLANGPRDELHRSH